MGEFGKLSLSKFGQDMAVLSFLLLENLDQ